MMRILTDAQENLLKDSRNLLNDLRASLIQFGATQEDHETLAQSIRQLDELATQRAAILAAATAPDPDSVTPLPATN